jgi:type I restriction enzyme S subunit
MENIQSGNGKLAGTVHPQEVKSSTFAFDSRHVLYGRLRPYLNKVLVPEFSGHCSTEIFPLRPDVSLDRRFLFYWLVQSSTVAAIDRTCTGARMPRANVDALLRFNIPLPALSEQNRIVSILDDAFAAITKATESMERLQNLSMQITESHFAAAMDRHTSHWSWRPLGDVCTNLDSRRVPITKSDRKPGPIPYYGASGIVDYVDGWIFDENLLLISEDGANLLSRVYPIAFSVSGKSWVNNHAHVLRFDSSLYQRFIERYINSISIAHLVGGMAQPKLNQRSLNSIPVPWSGSPEEVAAAVQDLDAIDPVATSLSDCYGRKKSLLSDLKQSLLHHAFTGQLTAKSADRLLAEAV